MDDKLAQQIAQQIKERVEAANEAVIEGEAAEIRQDKIEEGADQAKQENLPELPEKPKSLKLVEEPRERADGYIEQEIEFGNGVKGKITYPKDAPAENKTKLVLNFDNLADEEVRRSLAEDGGKNNDIVVDIALPEGQKIVVDGEELDVVSTLVQDIETMQQNSAIQVKARPTEIVTLVKNTDKLNQVQRAVKKYKENSPFDHRAKTAVVIDLSAEQPISEEVAVEADAYVSSPSDAPSAPSSPVSNAGQASETENTPVNPEQTATASPAPSETSEEAVEKISFEGKVAIFGDSNLASIDAEKLGYAEGGINHAVNGAKTFQVLSALEREKNNLQGAENILYAAGINDIGANVSVGEIESNINKFVELAKSIDGIKQISICTIPPFGGYGTEPWKSNRVISNGENLTTEERRVRLNSLIRSLGSDKVKIIDAAAELGSGEVNEFGAEILKSDLNSHDNLHIPPQQYAAFINSQTTPTKPEEASAAPVERAPKTYQRWIPADHRKVAYLAKRLQKEWIGKKPIGHDEMVQGDDGKMYQARVRRHTLQAATGRTGDFYAVEIWEENPDYEA